MALKKFEEYAKEFVSKDKTIESPIFKTIGSKEKEAPISVTEKTKVKDLKSSPKPSVNKVISTKKINENAFLVGDDFKVKVVIDIPKSLVQEYIEKVKEETDKNPLDNFSEAEIAEQIVTFIVKNNLVIDNLTPDFTVGTENVGSTQKTQAQTKNDAEELSSDLGVEDTSSEEDNDGEIEFNDFNDSEEPETLGAEEESDGEIEFNEEPEKKDLAEERKVDGSESDPDSNFEEIEFEDETQKDDGKYKTVGDLKKQQGQNVETPNKEDNKTTEEEEDIEDMYKKIGYKVGYYEKIDLNNLRKF